MSYIHGVFSNQTIFVWGCLLKLVPTLNETDTEYFFLMHRLTSNIKRQRAETIRQSSSHHYIYFLDLFHITALKFLEPEIIPLEPPFPNTIKFNGFISQNVRGVNPHEFQDLFSTNRWETPNPRQRTRWWWSCTGPTFFQKGMG